MSLQEALKPKSWFTRLSRTDLTGTWWLLLADGATVTQLGERTHGIHALDGEVSVAATALAALLLSFYYLHR